MRNLLLTILILFSINVFSHEKTKEDKQKVYRTIKSQLDSKKIDVKTAQKMWLAYIHCCNKKKGAK